jgi:hypothetical protein
MLHFFTDLFRKPAPVPTAVEEPAPADRQPAVGPGTHYPAGTAPGALQARHLEPQHVFGTQPAGDPCPRGMTYQEAIAPLPAWEEPGTSTDLPPSELIREGIRVTG